MLKHAEIIKSKFNIVIQILNKHFGKHNEILTWSEPNGGYFINITTQKNCAKKIVSMCKQAGVIFTDAGATFPYKNNPEKVAIKKSTKKNIKKIQEDIGDFLPYDMSKQQHLRTVVKMKRLLEQAIKEHYTKQKS